jgi:regulator of replication initiation timing
MAFDHARKVMRPITVVGTDFNFQIPVDVLCRTSSLMVDHAGLAAAAIYRIQSPVTAASFRAFMAGLYLESDLRITPHNISDLLQLAQEFGATALTKRLQAFAMSDCPRFPFDVPLEAPGHAHSAAPPQASAGDDVDELSELEWQLAKLQMDFQGVTQCDQKVDQFQTQMLGMQQSQEQIGDAITILRVEVSDLQQRFDNPLPALQDQRIDQLQNQVLGIQQSQGQLADAVSLMRIELTGLKQRFDDLLHSLSDQMAVLFTEGRTGPAAAAPPIARPPAPNHGNPPPRGPR